MACPQSVDVRSGADFIIVCRERELCNKIRKYELIAVIIRYQA